MVKHPLIEVANINYQQGPQMIKSEDSFVGYVSSTKEMDEAEVSVVEEIESVINQKIESGELQIPSGGCLMSLPEIIRIKLGQRNA